MILWTKYDPKDRSIESHVDHLVITSSGVAVLHNMLSHWLVMDMFGAALVVTESTM